jgi:hypothetical protein
MDSDFWVTPPELLADREGYFRKMLREYRDTRDFFADRLATAAYGSVDWFSAVKHYRAAAIAVDKLEESLVEFEYLKMKGLVDV